MAKPKKSARRKAPKKPPGPKADRLVIQGDWEEAVKKALRKPRREASKSPEGA